MAKDNETARTMLNGEIEISIWEDSYVVLYNKPREQLIFITLEEWEETTRFIASKLPNKTSSKEVAND